jgi:ferrochelatase
MSEPIDRLIVVPLFPQYASASAGSALESVYRLLGSQWNVPPVSVVPPFFDDAGFLDAWRDVTAPVLEIAQPDHVLMSFHGLPERQIRKSDPTGRHCLVQKDCCAHLGPKNRYCYRAQCMATSRGIAERLRLSPDQYSVSFQSRLGQDAWLTPATDQRVPELARQGVRRLVVLCPAFVADCLETLEEIGLRARESFLEAGGEEFQLVPCLNVHTTWLDALEALIRARL